MLKQLVSIMREIWFELAMIRQFLQDISFDLSTIAKRKKDGAE